MGRTLWLEFKYTEAAQWRSIVGRADRNVDFWGQAVKTPEDWKLDSNLGGGPLLPPGAMGTLVSSFVQFRLDVSSPRFLIDHAFEAPPESRPARKRPPREARSLDEDRAKKTRVRRKQRRKVMVTGPVLKRPASLYNCMCSDTMKVLFTHIQPRTRAMVVTLIVSTPLQRCPH